MKSQIKDLVTVFLIQLVLTLPFYTADVYGLTISNVRVTKVTSNSATIEWNTGNISNGRVRYGKTPSLGFTQRHDNFIDNHTITVYNGIDSDTTYFFAVESTELNGATAIDNNSGNFYNFKTTDIRPPPQVKGLKAVSAANSIALSWDALNITDLSHYVVYRSRVPVANTTTNSFQDTNISSGTEFNYKVSAVDTTGNEGPQSDALIVSTARTDSASPVISNIDVLPITDTTARVTWLTNENSTSIVLYGINKTDKAKSSNELEINHTIVIDALVKNEKYIFIVKSCDLSNNCANSSNQSFSAGRDTKIPFINLSIPRFVKRRVIDLIGSTKPFSSVTLFVNNMDVPKRSLSSSEVGGSGKFAFTQIQLEQDNVIKIAIVDKSGNKNQKTFDVSIDTEEPIVQLNDMPSLTSKSNLTISGTVNEFVIIKVFVDINVNESSVPFKITRLNTTKIGQNSVELQWEESKDNDFSHYVVYRNDVPIAITKPANYNLYIDAVVDTETSYTYQVSAVNIFAVEGPRSEPITVTTLKGGAILNLKPPEVELFEDFRKPLMSTNASGSFNFGVRLDKGDEAYHIKLMFEDKANNSVIIEKSVTLDTKKPEVKIIRPPSGAFIYENTANEIDIVGQTKPNARVHLFIDRTPFSFYNESLEISGLPDELENLPEIELDAKCRSSVSISFCKTGADFSTSADTKGNFKFENVDLTAMFGGAGRIREVPVTEFRDTLLNEEAKESKKTTLVVIATDQTGQRGVATQAVRIGTCWSGNQSWNVIPLTQYQSPTLLSTERLAEGTETIYFYFNYEYIGRGTDAKMTDISLSKACSRGEMIDPRFNISCKILPSGGNAVLNKPDNTKSYSAVTLERFPGMDKFLKDDWDSFFKGINKELTFPFKVRIRYKHHIIDGDGTQKEITETQTTCEQVSYVVDDTIIDPREVLPDWILFDFVDFLQDSIETLTDVQEKINNVLNYVAVGCMASFGLNLVLGVYRRWVTFWEEKTYAIKDKIKFNDALAAFKLTKNQQYEADCRAIIGAIKDKHTSFKLKYVNDIDLKKCFPASAAAWESEAKVYQYLRWSCDRVFGHAAPAKWTETKDDTELYNKVQRGEGCAVDESVIGQPVRVESCKELVKSLGRGPTISYNEDDKCVLLKEKDLSGKVTEGLARVGQLVQGSINLYRIEKPTEIAAIKIDYAIKKDETHYLTAQSQKCEEVCGKSVTSTSNKGRLVVEPYGKEGKVKLIRDTKDTKGENPTLAYCTPVNDCISLNARTGAQKLHVIEEGQKPIEVKYAFTRGFTSDCFYDPDDQTLKNPSVVSDSPEQRYECCCINAKEGVITQYYEPNDYDPTFNEPNKKVHESKSSGKAAVAGELTPATKYEDMKWSYRYWKEKFEAKGKDGTIHNEYNPKRYIEGRDKPACFGQNNLLYEYISQQPERVLTVDPFRQHEASIQCVHLAGISNRIQFIKNLMTSLSTCLIQVRTTGRGDAGACKELFTQYLCNAIWQLIRWFVDGCVPVGVGLDFDKQNDNIATYIRAGFKGVYESINDLQSQITNEYGNAKLNELLGTGEESIARKICLGAFGYDWEFNVRNVVDAAYATPFATLVQPITRSREFLTIEPVSLRPKYEYRASWLINPGCDFERYDVYLTCAGRKQLDQYPNSVNCGALGAPSIAYTGALGTSAGYSQCDCIYLKDERIGPLVFSGRLKQNVLEDQELPSGQRVVESSVRYDHLKFVLRADRKITPNIKPNCFPTGYDDGVFYFPLIDKTARDIADCTADYNSGSLICRGGTTFFSKKGIAEIIEVTINDERAENVKELSIGEPLSIGARVTKTGKDKCLRVSLSPDPMEAEYRGITLNGANDIDITIPRLKIAGRAGNIESRDVMARLISQQNPDPVRISIKVFDKQQKDDEQGYRLYDKEDTVIIDGWRVDLSSGELKEEDNSNRDTTITVNDGVITVEKEGAIIEITDVSYNRQLEKSDQTSGESIKTYELQEIITINPRQQATQTSQRKTLTLEIFHLKDDRDSYSNVDDCNLNDKIFERPYSFVVSDKKVDKTKLGPTIEVVRPDPPQQYVGNPVEISARITHPLSELERNPITVKKAEITIYDPDTKKIVGPARIDKLNDDVGYLYKFDTNNKKAGKYSGKIEATSTNGESSSKNFKFELKDRGAKAPAKQYT